ncbi:hypothetical protein [Phenylobacterium soli]|nr:hypothetical protein [Phenylobacterium soli]
MAKNTKGGHGDAPGEALDLDALDQVVGGADTKPPSLFGGLLDTLTTAIEQTPTKVVQAVEETRTAVSEGLKYANATASISEDIVRATSGKSGAAAANAMEDVIRGSAKTIASSLGVSQAVADTLAWSAAYKAVFETGSAARAGSAALEAMKNDLRAHVGDVCKGLANEISYGGALKTSLSRASDAMADAIAKAGPAAEREITEKGKIAFETGLELAKKHPVGKAVMAALDDPKNTDAWSKVVSEIAVSKGLPKQATAVKFLLEGMTSQAVAKAIGLGDFPPQVKQTAKALVTTLENVERAVVDLHSKSFVEGMTFGLGIKGIVDIGLNAAQLGKALVSGDTGAMQRAAQALVTDAFNDMKDGLNRAYVQGAAKAFDYTKDITMGLLNGLGATPYAEVAVREAGKAMTEFGNMAKNGSVAAANAIADFAKNDVAGAGVRAVDELRGVAKTAGAAADTAVDALGTAARSGAKYAEGAVNALIDVSRSPGASAVKAVGALGDIAESSAGQARYAAYALVDLSRAAGPFAQHAMGELNGLARSGTRQAAIAVEGLTDIAKSGAKFAQDAVFTLMDVSRSGAATAVQAVNGIADVAKSGAQQATAAVNGLVDLGKASGKQAELAVNALGDVAKSGVRQASLAVDGLKSLGESGAQCASKAIDTLGSVAKSGSAYANQAIDALKGLSGHAEYAGKVLKGVADSGIDYAKSAWDSVSSFFKGLF